MRFLVTGGAGFIGSALCRYLADNLDEEVIVVDKLTYAANLASLNSVAKLQNFSLLEMDICDRTAMDNVLDETRPDIIIHLAAESHVDRSIDGPSDFIATNIVGTYTLLEAARAYYSQLDKPRKNTFRFHHVSTDEVYGDLPLDKGIFTEDTAYAPSSPYSATKAASDHLVRAWCHTYGLPVVISNCSNNYGTHQFPEKLIPLMILNAMEGSQLPVYGTGENVRDWLNVDDHARALHLVATRGEIGQSYNIGGNAEYTNLQIVKMICEIMDELQPLDDNKAHESLITFVKDRPGHDLRYAIDASKIARELGFTPSMSFEQGLRATVEWYLNNEDWWKPIREGRYRGERLGNHA